MRRGFLVRYSDRFDFSLDDSDLVYASTENCERLLSMENCDRLFGERKTEYVLHMIAFIDSERDGLVILQNIVEDFLQGSSSIRCDAGEFAIIRQYLHDAGWSWFGGFGKTDMSLLDEIPEGLAALGVKFHKNEFIPYYEDEIEYIDFAGALEAKELIRIIRLRELGI